MRKSLLIPLSILLLAPAAFAGEPKTYGEALPEASAVPISVAAADTDAYAGKANRFSGRITEVCQKEGCWMMLEDDGQVARVMMHDHAFAIPKDASGPAEVYGVLSVKQLSKEAAEHLAEDGNGPAEVYGVLSVKQLSKEAAEHLAEDGNGILPPEREIRIDATGVRIDG